MSEEEIIKSVLHIQNYIIENGVEVGVNTWSKVNSLGQLVDLYYKRKAEVEHYKEKEQAETDDFENRDRWK